MCAFNVRLQWAAATIRCNNDNNSRERVKCRISASTMLLYISRDVLLLPRSNMASSTLKQHTQTLHNIARQSGGQRPMQRHQLHHTILVAAVHCKVHAA